MQAREALGERVRLGVDDEVDRALPVEHDVLVPVPGDRLEAELLEDLAERRWIGRGVFDELEAGGTHRVVPGFKRHLDLLWFGRAATGFAGSGGTATLLGEG